MMAMEGIDDHSTFFAVGGDGVLYISVSIFLTMNGIDRVEEARLHENPLWAAAVVRGPETDFDLGGNMLLPCDLFHAFVITVNETNIADEAKRAAFNAWRRRACTDIWRALSDFQTTNPVNEDPAGFGAAFNAPGGRARLRLLH